MDSWLPARATRLAFARKQPAHLRERESALSERRRLGRSAVFLPLVRATEAAVTELVDRMVLVNTVMYERSSTWCTDSVGACCVSLQLTEKNKRIVKNYGIWIRYNSRSGTHNMYKEYRDVTLCSAVEQLYAELAGRHRARPRSIQIMRTAIVAAKDTKKLNVQQFHDSKIKFPLARRIPRPATKNQRTVFKANRPTTFRG